MFLLLSRLRELLFYNLEPCRLNLAQLPKDMFISLRFSLDVRHTCFSFSRMRFASIEVCMGSVSCGGDSHLP